MEKEASSGVKIPAIFCSLSDQSPAECKYKEFGNLISKDKFCSGNVLFVYQCPYRFDYTNDEK